MRRMHQIGMPGVVVAMSLFLGTAAHAALTNPGFETDNASGGDVIGATGWGAGFNANFTTATQAHTGSQSLKVFGPFFQFGGAGTTQAQPAIVGTSYTASAYAMTPTSDSINGSNFAAVKVEFLDGSNTVIGSFESAHLTAASPFDTWTLLSATGAAPAGTVNAQIVLVHVQLNSPPTGGAVFFDDASLAVVPEPAVGMMGLMLVGGIVLRSGRKNQRKA
jgi:hypothetical protein